MPLSDMDELKLIGLVKCFGGLRAVDSVSLGVAAGKITALVGPNGAGKTTLFNLISGLLKPDQGEMYFQDKRIDGLPRWEIARLGVGRLFQDVRVFRNMSVLENVISGTLFHPGEIPPYVLFSPRKVTRVEKKAERDSLDWIEFVGLAGRERSPAGALSFGQQKLVATARLLAGGHRLLLLDEPTAGVSPAMTESFLALIKRIAKMGRTVLLIEHNMTVVLSMADWVYFLDDGKVVSFGLPRDVLGDPEVRRTYVGI